MNIIQLDSICMMTMLLYGLSQAPKRQYFFINCTIAVLWYLLIVIQPIFYDFVISLHTNENPLSGGKSILLMWFVILIFFVGRTIKKDREKLNAQRAAKAVL